MSQLACAITENALLTADVCRMALAGDTSAITAPGQFIRIAPEARSRRPKWLCSFKMTTS